ncbi:MAG: bacteriohemerythrin [Holophagaceae bacterium]|nr:bacteriohemerythrin [Holophagaceae bacterium]
MATSFTYATWTPDMATGNAIVDDQHKQLIDSLNQLFDAHKSGKGSKEVKRMMIFLVDYTVKHFTEEEGILTKYNYPDLDNHKKIHANFTATAKNLLQDLLQDIASGGPSDEMITNVYVIVGKWVISHIKVQDTKWAEFVKSQK